MKKRRAHIPRGGATPANPAADKENAGVGIIGGIKQSFSKDSLVVSKQDEETIPGSPKNLSLNFSLVEESPIIGRSRVAHGIKGGCRNNLGINFGRSNNCALASLRERKNFQNVLQPRKLPLSRPMLTRSSPRLGVQSSEVDQHPCLNRTSLLTKRQCKDKTNKINSEGESPKSSSVDSSASSANETVVHAGRKGARMSVGSSILSQKNLTHKKVLPEAKGTSDSFDHVEPTFEITRRVTTRNRKQTKVAAKKTTIKRPQKKRGGKIKDSKQEDHLENLHNIKPIIEPSTVVNRSKLRGQATVDTEEMQSISVRESATLTTQRKCKQRNKGSSTKAHNLKQAISEVDSEKKVGIHDSLQSKPDSSKTVGKRKFGTLDTTKEIAIKKPKMSGSGRAKSPHSSLEVLAPSRMECNKVLPSVDQKKSILTHVKSKLPIWYTTDAKRTPVARNRKSKRLTALTADEVFAFSFNPEEEEGTRKVKRKKKRKPAARKPCPKPKMKSTYMITDPSWQQEIEPRTSGSTLISNKSETKGQDYNILSVDDNYVSDHDIPDCGDTDEVMQEMEFETCSAFINTVSSTDSGPLFSIPTSISACPTPALPKNISKFAASTSTPRLEESMSLLSRKGHISKSKLDKPVEEEIKECFGFNEDEADELDISPVRRSHTQSNFEITGFSDKFESSVGALPSRFSWGSLRRGQRSYSSMTRSLSMVNHGRSSVSAMSASHMSNTALQGKSNGSGMSLSRASRLLNQGRSNDSGRSFSKHLSDNINTKRRRNTSRTEEKINTEKGEENKTQEKAIVIENGNLSILFDEEPVEAEETAGEECVQREEKSVGEKCTSHVDKVIVCSPLKTFKKAPRHSYDRQVLELSRKKFLEQHGVSASGDLRTDGVKGKISQASSQKAKQTKSSSKKVKKKKLTKKKHKSSEDSKDESSQSISSEKEKPKRQKRSKKATALEKSFQDWCSDLNNHFSEIEDMELVVQ